MSSASEPPTSGATANPSGAQPPLDTNGLPNPSDRPWWKRWWVIALAPIVLVAVITNLADNGDSAEPQAEPSITTEEPASEADTADGADAEPAGHELDAPDVVGMTLDEARTLLDGFEVEEIDGSGKDRSVWNASNWTVTDQTVDGTAVTLHIINERDNEDSTPAPSTSEGLTATYAQAACDRFADQEFVYGVKMHWITGRLAEEYLADEDQWFLKVEATVTNAFGAKQSGVNVECYVTGTNERPEVVDFIYY